MSIELNADTIRNPKALAAAIVKYRTDPRLPQALAAAILTYVASEVDTTSLTSLFYDIVDLTPGQTASVHIEDGHYAIVVDSNGKPVMMDVADTEVTAQRIHIASHIKLLWADLAQGFVRPIADQQTTLTQYINDQQDRVAINALSESVPDENIIQSPGGKVSELAFNQAVTIINEWDKEIGNIITRATRINVDMKRWKLSEMLRDDLLRKGVVKTFNGANVDRTSRCPSDEMLLTPVETVGTLFNIIPLDIRQDFSVPPKYLGLYAEKYIGVIVRKPKYLSKIKVTA